MNKTKPSPNATPAASAPAPEPIAYKTNPEIDAKINEFIREKPKFWQHIQSMPRDRLERTVILSEIRDSERRLRNRESILKQIERKPELKQALETLVKHLPEDQRESAMLQLATRQRRLLSGQSQAQSENQGVRPSVG